MHKITLPVQNIASFGYTGDVKKALFSSSDQNIRVKWRNDSHAWKIKMADDVGKSSLFRKLFLVFGDILDGVLSHIELQKREF